MSNSFFRKASWIFALLCSIIIFGQNENALLWKISGKGLSKPSYVFGTVHMMCEEDYVMNTAIENALKDSEAYFAELDFTNVEEMSKMQAQIMSKTPLSQRLNTEDYQKIKALLKETFNLDIAQFENMTDMGIVSMVSLKAFQCDTYKMYEMELLKMALAEKKKPGGIETFDEQMKVLSKTFTTETLISMLEDFKKKGYEGTKQMIALYESQKIDDLINFMGEASYMDEEVYDTILKQRNDNWMVRMPQIMKDQSTFFAVGAAHLGGKDGVITQLKKSGYKVESVKF